MTNFIKVEMFRFYEPAISKDLLIILNLCDDVPEDVSRKNDFPVGYLCFRSASIVVLASRQLNHDFILLSVVKL